MRREIEAAIAALRIASSALRVLSKAQGITLHVSRLCDIGLTITDTADALRELSEKKIGQVNCLDDLEENQFAFPATGEVWILRQGEHEGELHWIVRSDDTLYGYSPSLQDLIQLTGEHIPGTPILGTYRFVTQLESWTYAPAGGASVD